MASDGNGQVSPYSTTKIAHHPEVLEALRVGADWPPLFVQWMPTNLCNQACEFCSYGHWKPGTQGPPASAWKNNKLFDEKQFMPQAKMQETVASLHALGCKAVEITGGGEPTTYPWFDEMVESIGKTGMEVALVSNGVLLTPDRVKRLADVPFTWARISIDAGSPETYCAIRHVPQGHFTKALQGLERLAKAKSHPEARVGMGYVIDRKNWHDVYMGCRIAKDHGADNVRVSVAFTPDAMNRWAPSQIDEAIDQVRRAKQDFESHDFHVSNLSRERWDNLLHTKQAYPYCYWKDVACVIGGDCKVYTCCSLAYNPMGLIGDLREQSFSKLWKSPEARTFRMRHNPRVDCPVWCLFERRNLDALKFIADPAEAEAVRARGTPLHVNFV